MLPTGTSINRIHLRVRNLDSVRTFYESLLGFQLVSSAAGTAHLATGHDVTSEVILVNDPASRMRKPTSPGLFHVAFLFPTRKRLSIALRRLIHARYPLQGFADHGVSEAVYLADPEGNGIELYYDRPQAAWKRENGMVTMGTEPLDVKALYDEGDGESEQTEAKIGHVHLQVSNLQNGESFYSSTLGFSVTQRSYPGALYLAAGDYHHHIGLNIWNSRNAQREEGTTGLISFGIAVPSEQDVTRLARHRGDPAAPFTLSDPDNTIISVEVSHHNTSSLTQQEKVL